MTIGLLLKASLHCRLIQKYFSTTLALLPSAYDSLSPPYGVQGKVNLETNGVKFFTGEIINRRRQKRKLHCIYNTLLPGKEVGKGATF